MNNIKYETIIFWSDEANSFIAEMPELQGCRADGETYKDAMRNIKTAANEWINNAKELGRDIPKPKGKLFYGQNF